MKMVDMQCPRCEIISTDVLLRDGNWEPACEQCHVPLVRVCIGGMAAAVHGDDIPGGVWIRHGICNADGTPRRYDSHSEMKREAKARGLVNFVEHVGTKGGDRNKYTQRFV
jgi:hypothetical protein